MARKCPNPDCTRSFVHRTRREGWERIFCRIFFRAYTCRNCGVRFVAPKSFAEMRTQIYGCSAVAVIGIAVMVSQFGVLTSALHGVFLPGSGSESGGEPSPVERAAWFARSPEERADIARAAKEKTILAVGLHREGVYVDEESGRKIVRALERPDDPIYKIVRRAFRNAGVPDWLVNRSLRDWSKGKSALEIGQEWIQQGVDVSGIVRDVEGQGIPARRLMQEKDTGR